MYIHAITLNTTCESTALAFKMPEFKPESVAHRTTAYTTLQKEYEAWTNIASIKESSNKSKA